MATRTALSFHDLAGLLGFLEMNRRKLSGLVAEIGEIQKEFQTRFVASQQRHDDRKAAFLAQAEASGWSVPVWLAQGLEEQLPAMRERLAAEREELRAALGELQEQRESLEAQSDQNLELLKGRNPLLNAREEQLKAREQALTVELEALGQEITATGAGLGWLTQAGRIAGLRAKYLEVAQRRERLSQELSAVRNTWSLLEKQTDEEERRRQEAWRLRVAETARLKARLAELERDFDRACRQAAAETTLAALPVGLAGAGPDTAELLQAQQAVRDYEQGLMQVAELIGQLQGVATGLDRLGESVKGMKAEQDMHAELKPLELSAPPVVVQFHGLWDDLAAAVKDEQAAAAAPAEFAQKLGQTIGTGLSSAAIEAMFEALGQELKQAADSQW